MSLWAIVKNFGLIIGFFKTVREVILEVVNGKTLPECDSSKKLIGDVRKLIDKKVIDLPGERDQDVSNMLKEVEDQFQCQK